MRRFRLLLAVFAGLLALELGFLTLVDTATRPLDRDGKPFRLDNIASGTAMTQKLEVGANGFEEIHLEGGISPGTASAVLAADLVELNDRGEVIQTVRTAVIEIPGSTTRCCTFRFEPVADSRWRAYRLDVHVGELNGRQLALWAAPAPVNGRFAINGRYKRAFLLFRTGASQGTGLARIVAAAPSTAAGVAVLMLLYNGIFAFLAHLLVNASDPQRA